jgi:AraC family transcriptional regulator
MEDHQSWNRYADFYRGSPYSVFPQEHRDSPGRLPFHMITVDQADHEFIDPSVPETVLTLPLRAAQENEWAWDMGHGWHNETAVPGRLLLLPSDNESRWRVKGARQLLVLTVPTKTIRQILGSTTPDRLQDAFRPLAEKTWEDEFVQLLMMRLWKATAALHSTDRMLVDGGLVTLVTHLVERSEAIQKPIKFVALPPWRLRRVFEYVDAHLHEPLDLVALADAAGLSVRHFARAFREELGETPHRWLMARRLERATDMLKKNELPLAQIAEACGFAGQSHFTKVFKQLTGDTPKRWFNSQNAE